MEVGKKTRGSLRWSVKQPKQVLNLSISMLDALLSTRDTETF